MTTTTEQTARRTCWAAYAASSLGSEISLHLTERAALDAVIDGLGLREHETDEGRAVCDMDEEELREFLDTHCSTRAADWDVQEVDLP